MDGAISGSFLDTQKGLVQSLPLAAALRDPLGRFVACNQLFLDLMGLSHEDEVIGRTALEISPEGWGPACTSSDAEVRESGNPVQSAVQVVRADGGIRDLVFNKSLCRDTEGRVAGVVSLLRDVTDALAAQRALSDSECRFARLAELSQEGVVLHDHGALIDVNAAFCHMTGWTRDEVRGRDYSILIGAESQAVARSKVEERSDKPYRLFMRRRDGSLFPAEVRGRSQNYAGAPIRVVTIVDITQRMEAEQAVAEREMLYRQMFETNASIKLLIDPESGEIVDANQAAVRFYGWPIERLRGKRITDINALPPAQVRHEMALAQAEDRCYFRFPHRLADGTVRSVEVFSGPVTYKGRHLLHSIIHDVTERDSAVRELERKTLALEQSNADLQQFAYVASHDLQEPLRTVVSYLQLIERRYKDRLDEEGLSFMAFAVDGAKRMSRMIQDLLAYSRVESQGSDLEPVDSEKALGLALNDLGALIEDAGATIERGPLPTVMGDGVQLVSVFQNLIGNAIKYRHRERKPVIRIGAEPAGDGKWRFTVADNGLGIDPIHHDRIFKLFQRLHSQSEYPGTGIGLALVKRIIGRHNGKVWVESAEGQGATFFFTLKGA